MRSLILISSTVLFFSCSTVRKTTDSHQVESRQTDNSTINSGYTRETVITEASSSQVSVPADSLSAIGYVPVGDTGTIVSESDGMEVATTSIPVKDSAGKTIGNTIHTKAKTNPKTVVAPVDKTTHIKEAGNSNEHKDITTTVKQKSKTTLKTSWRPSAGVQIVISLAVIVGLLFVVYKFIKR